MRYSRIVVSLIAAASILIPLSTNVGAAPSASGVIIRQISAGGATSFAASSTQSSPDISGVQTLEIGPNLDGGNVAGVSAPVGGSAVINQTSGVVNRSRSAGRPEQGDASLGDRTEPANPEVHLSFDGMNHRNQRLANGGNQFSLEPPDQGLCAGNNFVMESLNDVLRVYDSNGNAISGVIDLNTFYGYSAAINRKTGVRGPFITDPSCYYDHDTQRWFNVVLTLDTNPATGGFIGSNHLDIAVSNSPDPTGSWTIYTLPVQDDGTQGTPDHSCSLNPDGTGHGPCLGDYPHIGADANGFYVTTNEYSFNGPEFKSANIYAFSKHALASGAHTVSVVQYDTPTADAGKPGFTVWPAESPDRQYRTDNHGTEFFLSSTAADEVNCPSGCTGPHSSNYIVLWKLTNTASLDSASPSPTLSNVAIRVRRYAVPPLSDQKAGDFPLGQCINDTTLPTPFGPGCWQYLFANEPAHNEVISHIDSNDTRMQQVTYANGKVWAALDTAVKVKGENRAGIEWFVVNPGSGKIDNQGYAALANNNLTYPAIGVTDNGHAVVAFTVVGKDYYPSAGYAGLDARSGMGPVHIAAAGRGPDDGFTSYKAYVGAPPRTRWGDYGSAVADGGSIWIASEYIGQTCTLAQYTTGAIGSCGGTRTALANWDTRISEVEP